MSTNVKLLIARVENPKNPFIVKPAIIHLISEMPEPAAYFPSVFTRWAAVNENAAANKTYIMYLAKVTWLHECHESHAPPSSPSISQQQNCWFNHQAS